MAVRADHPQPDRGWLRKDRAVQAEIELQDLHFSFIVSSLESETLSELLISSACVCQSPMGESGTSFAASGAQIFLERAGAEIAAVSLNF